ncbi:hypothetical protein CI610_02032 [invertebrate metagenome]|uniref:Uncharacterized protein n=1 Tax=invertebrate metagenome TaxID=1711999 RepID=A0A2H9T727_9ZZZZ
MFICFIKRFGLNVETFIFPVIWEGIIPAFTVPLRVIFSDWFKGIISTVISDNCSSLSLRLKAMLASSTDASCIEGWLLMISAVNRTSNGCLFLTSPVLRLA